MHVLTRIYNNDILYSTEQKGVLSIVEQVFFKVDQNGQMYIDFEVLEEAGVAVDVVRDHVDMIVSSDKYMLDGFYVNRQSREFVILYSSVAVNTGVILQDCVVVPFNSRDYSVLPHDVYVRGAF